MSTSTPIPLSARKSPCLDLNTVERRGQPNCPKPEPKQSRPHGLQEAPTFRPTEEEFRNGPIDYIRSIEVEGRKYGIVKIVPPDGWNPDFAIDTEVGSPGRKGWWLTCAAFSFPNKEAGTQPGRRRYDLRLRPFQIFTDKAGTRANLNYLDALAKFHKIRSGANLNRFPSVDKRPLDLYKLKKFVEDKGGFDNVCRGKRWAEIGRDLGYSGKIMSSLSTSLKNSYQKWLQPYEDYLRENRPGVLQQQEKDHGGPYTPSPSQTPAKSAKQSPAPGSPSPVQRASAALSAALQESPAPKIESPPPSGFAAVNAVGFKAVNAPSSGFSAINGPPPRAPRPTTPISGKASAAPDAEPSRSTSIGAPRVAEIQSEALNPLKRQHSADDLACGDSDGSGRRSKRQKKGNCATSSAFEAHIPDGAPTVTGSHMIQPRISAPKSAAPRDRSNDKPGDVSRVSF
jgi:histone demethylase JARID1